jgi:hypothetical protein
MSLAAIDLYRKLITWGVLVLVGFIGGMGLHKMVSDRKIAKMQADWAENVIAATEATAAAEKEQRRIEQERRSDVDKAKETLGEERTRNAALAASLDLAHRRADGLRGKLQTFATVASPAGQDPARACETRATTLAGHVADGIGLLEEGRSLFGRCAKDRDDFAAEVRALVSAWPE